MTTYLRDFVQNVSDVPAELRRHFEGLKELDDKVVALQHKVDEDCMAQLTAAAERQLEAAGASPSKRQRMHSARGEGVAAAEADAELTRRIEQNMNKIISLSEEKMQRAQQAYDYIDQHINNLDRQLHSFDADVAKERQKLGLPPAGALGAIPEAGTSKGGLQRKWGRAKAAAAAPAPPEAVTDEDLYLAALAVSDPMDPKYCYCKRISYGEMIACDNAECPVEWYHFGCVGLTQENRPKGKWYCKECRKLMKK